VELKFSPTRGMPSVKWVCVVASPAHANARERGTRSNACGIEVAKVKPIYQKME